MVVEESPIVPGVHRLPWNTTSVTLSATFAVIAGLLVCWVSVLVGEPDDGTDAAGMLIVSVTFMALLFAGGGAGCLAWALHERRHPPSIGPWPAWAEDPWRHGRLRFWDGRSWTAFIVR